MVGIARTPLNWGFVLVALSGGACAAGSEQPPTGAAATGDPTTGPGGGDAASTASSGSATATTSSQVASSGGGAGGPGSGGAGPGSGGEGPGSGGAAPGSGGAGGNGSGSGGAGGNGSGTGGGGTGGSSGAGGTGPTSGVVAFFAIKANGAFAAVRDESGDYTTDDLGGTYAAGSRPALTMRTATAAVGFARGSAGALLYTTFNGASWLAPTAVGLGITTDDTPAIASALDGVAYGTFHGTDDKHYYAEFDGAGFDPDDDPVGGAGPAQAFGPSAASIAVVGGDALVAQAGDDQDVHVIANTVGGWVDAHIAVTPTTVDRTPAIAAIDEANGGDALVVFAGEDTKLYWSIRDGGIWSATDEIADALTSDPPSVVATPEGAVVAFRGTNGGIYAALFDGAGWAAPELLVPITTTTSSTPALAIGAGDADAELAFVRESDGAVVHLRLLNGSFGAPTTVGGTGLTGVAIGASP